MSRDKDNIDEFFRYIDTGDLNGLKQYVNSNTLPTDLVDRNGQSALSHVINLSDATLDSSGKIDFAKYLKSINSPLDYPDSDKVRPIHLAVKTQNEDMVKFLISNGANLGSKDQDSNNPMHYAIPKYNEECITDTPLLNNTIIDPLQQDILTFIKNDPTTNKDYLDLLASVNTYPSALKNREPDVLAKNGASVNAINANLTSLGYLAFLNKPAYADDENPIIPDIKTDPNGRIVELLDTMNKQFIGLFTFDGNKIFPDFWRLSQLGFLSNNERYIFFLTLIARTHIYDPTDFPTLAMDFYLHGNDDELIIQNIPIMIMQQYVFGDIKPQYYDRYLSELRHDIPADILDPYLYNSSLRILYDYLNGDNNESISIDSIITGVELTVWNTNYILVLNSLGINQDSEAANNLFLSYPNVFADLGQISSILTIIYFVYSNYYQYNNLDMKISSVYHFKINMDDYIGDINNMVPTNTIINGFNYNQSALDGYKQMTIYFLQKFKTSITNAIDTDYANYRDMIEDQVDLSYEKDPVAFDSFFHRYLFPFDYNKDTNQDTNDNYTYVAVNGIMDLNNDMMKFVEPSYQKIKNVIRGIKFGNPKKFDYENMYNYYNLIYDDLDNLYDEVKWVNLLGNKFNVNFLLQQYFLVRKETGFQFKRDGLVYGSLPVIDQSEDNDDNNEDDNNDNDDNGDNNEMDGDNDTSDNASISGNTTTSNNTSNSTTSNNSSNSATSNDTSISGNSTTSNDTSNSNSTSTSNVSNASSINLDYYNSDLVKDMVFKNYVLIMNIVSLTFISREQSTLKIVCESIVTMLRNQQYYWIANIANPLIAKIAVTYEMQRRFLTDSTANPASPINVLIGNFTKDLHTFGNTRDILNFNEIRSTNYFTYIGSTLKGTSDYSIRALAAHSTISQLLDAISYYNATTLGVRYFNEPIPIYSDATTYVINSSYYGQIGNPPLNLLINNGEAYYVTETPYMNIDSIQAVFSNDEINPSFGQILVENPIYYQLDFNSHYGGLYQNSNPDSLKQAMTQSLSYQIFNKKRLVMEDVLNNYTSDKTKLEVARETEVVLDYNLNLVTTAMIFGWTNGSKLDQSYELKQGTTDLSKYVIGEENQVSYSNVVDLSGISRMCYRWSPQIMNLILSGKNINGKNVQGDTPLHLAVRSANAAAVLFLINNGAVELKNFNGYTPYGELEVLINQHNQRINQVSNKDVLNEFDSRYIENAVEDVKVETDNKAVISIPDAVNIAVIMYNFYYYKKKTNYYPRDFDNSDASNLIDYVKNTGTPIEHFNQYYNREFNDSPGLIIFHNGVKLSNNGGKNLSDLDNQAIFNILVYVTQITIGKTVLDIISDISNVDQSALTTYFNDQLIGRMVNEYAGYKYNNINYPPLDTMINGIQDYLSVNQPVSEYNTNQIKTLIPWFTSNFKNGISNMSLAIDNLKKYNIRSSELMEIKNILSN